MRGVVKIYSRRQTEGSSWNVVAADCDTTSVGYVIGGFSAVPISYPRASSWSWKRVDRREARSNKLDCSRLRNYFVVVSNWQLATGRRLTILVRCNLHMGDPRNIHRRAAIYQLS